MDSPRARERPSSARPRIRSRRLSRGAALLAPIIPLLLLLLAALHRLAPQGQGFWALTQIFAPYLFLAAVPCVLLLHTARVRRLGIGMLACLLVFCARFGSSLVSIPPRETSQARQLSALTWNLELTNQDLATIRTVLLQSSADIVGLQELTQAQARALDADPELRQRFPYRLLDPRSHGRGLGVLSRFPIMDQAHSSGTLPQTVRLAIAADSSLTVINAHPPPARIRLPLRYDPTRRDTQIAAVRERIELALAQGTPLLVLGDFNVTEREPTYVTLTKGLQDAHLLVGQGPGHSWRPAPLKRIPFGVLRIDYMLASPQLRPLRINTDCTPRGSDHCSIHGVFELL